jgi:16S rRNA (guanine527-N7)-methyltransferase
LFAHYTLFLRWNKVLNLSSIADFRSAVARHYCESLFLASKLLSTPCSIVDIGSGAGFPGFPIAVVRPDCRVCLVESRQRKAAFLKEATRAMRNVEVRAQRAGELSDGFDWLVSRAVAWNDLRPVALRVASQIALLSSVSEADSLMLDKRISWREVLPLPWGRQIVLLMGCVPRET